MEKEKHLDLEKALQIAADVQPIEVNGSTLLDVRLITSVLVFHVHLKNPFASILAVNTCEKLMLYCE